MVVTALVVGMATYVFTDRYGARSASSTVTVATPTPKPSVDVLAAGLVPNSWHRAFNESPMVLASLEDMTVSNAGQLIMQDDSGSGICFAGGCDYADIMIHMVDAPAVRTAIALNKGKAYVPASGLTYGDSWQVVTLDGEPVDVLVNTNEEDKYSGMQAYFLFGKQAPEANGEKTVPVAYVVTVLHPKSAGVDTFLHTINLDALPSYQLAPTL